MKRVQYLIRKTRSKNNSKEKEVKTNKNKWIKLNRNSKIWKSKKLSNKAKPSFKNKDKG